MLQNLSLRSLVLSVPMRLAAVIILVLLATLSLSAVLSQLARAQPVPTGDGTGGSVDADPGGGSSVTFLPVDVAGGVCTAPDNGLGTADLPAELCKYIAPTELMMIIDGLPPGTTVEITPTLSSYTNISVTAGGTLGGQKYEFDAVLTLEMRGTGSLLGFNRTIHMQVALEIHTGPRTPGDPVQIFPADLFDMQGTIFGDPDFDTLAITAGTNNGLPSPGHVAITELPSGDYAIDSFFDITYRIDFQGAPGGALEGLSGSTTTSMRIESARFPCTGPDNGSGSPDLPPTFCSYEPLGDRMRIIDGLPPANTL